LDTKPTPKAKTSEPDAYVMLERLQMIVTRKVGASARQLHEHADAGEIAPPQPFDPRVLL
jgi:hypothetical protein